MHPGLAPFRYPSEIFVFVFFLWPGSAFRPSSQHISNTTCDSPPTRPHASRQAAHATGSRRCANCMQGRCTTRQISLCIPSHHPATTRNYLLYWQRPLRRCVTAHPIAPWLRLALFQGQADTWAGGFSLRPLGSDTNTTRVPACVWASRPVLCVGAGSRQFGRRVAR